MTSLRRAVPAVIVAFLMSGLFCSLAFADTSHARIVRLSLVQGDVRFTRDVKGDPLSDTQQGWETAVLNLPIRQGYVIATDNGRAEVEFENGAQAFLAENTVLQFYDLSSEDGGFTTRLILRQGSAEFSVNPGREDYFSVTGGDFSVQAEGKATFRMNSFDDGSNVAVLHGRVTALTNGKNTELAKGQELSMRAGDAESVEVGRAGDTDEFDQWTAARVATQTAATTAAEQYTNSSGYVSGYDDLYTYGAWFPVAGYGYCWQPYGAGFGWSPFGYGSWYYDTAFGWAFLGGYPWGWLPYHYGGWFFQPGLGWVWSPNGALGSPGVGRWRPVTGVWMRNATGGMAIVPSHPLDTHGRTPMNLAQGLFEVTPRGVTQQLAAESDAKWKVENKPSRELIQNQLAEAAAPTRVARTMAASAVGGRGAAGAGGTGGSTIVFDQREHRFVNSNTASASTARSEKGASGTAAEQNAEGNAEANARTGARVPPASDRLAGREGQTRQFVPSPRATPAPPSVPRSVTTERVFHDGGGAAEGSRGAGAGAERGAGSAGIGSVGASGAGRASGGAPSSAGGAGGGGRPH